MVDFVELLQDDFVKGNVVFLGSQADAADIEHTMLGGLPPYTDRLVGRRHPTATEPDLIFYACKDAYPDWHGQNMDNELLRGKIVILWETIDLMIESLREDSVCDIIEKFLESRAYINISGDYEDIADEIDTLGKMIEMDGVDAGFAGGVHHTPKSYIEYLREENYMNLYVDQINGSRELNAANTLGIGTHHSYIQHAIVYPISYLAKKMAGENTGTLYTDEDFNKIFN